MTSPSSQRGVRGYEWINRRAWPLAAVLVVGAVGLAILSPVVANEGDPSFSPGGEIYDIHERAGDVFSSSSPIRAASYIVENPDGGDVLTRDSLAELKRYEDQLKGDPVLSRHLAVSFDSNLGLEIDGVYSIADAVDEALPGGLGVASNADVKAVLSDLLADDAPTSGLRFLLSTKQTTREPTIMNGRNLALWESPAFFATVLFDVDSFDPAQATESFGETSNLDAERWLRKVQATLRGDQDHVTAIGVAIDEGLVGEELGGVVSAILMASVIRGPIVVADGGHYLTYRVPLTYGGALVVAYILATCGSLLLSSDRRVALFGVVNLVAVIGLAALVEEGIISLWCVWAAVTSVVIALHLRRTDPHGYRIQPAGATP